MHFTQAQRDEMQGQISRLPKYSAPFSQITPNGFPASTGSKSLLSYISYVPAERKQGNCGDCWVWASTGALEIDHAVRNGINKRLSVQYFNSKYKNGAGNEWACCGGWVSQFASWYNTDKTVLPWSNWNAGFGDASQLCLNYQTKVPVESISQKPHYSLNSLSYKPVDTFEVSQGAAINNIKSALNANKSVVYSYWYGVSGWDDFFNFWDHNDESSIFNPDSHANEVTNGGHSVLIVGYNDTVPGSEHWVALNSWGTRTGRPHGLFRLKMYMNYNSTDFSGGLPYQQHLFEILNSDFPVEAVPVANFAASSTSGTTPLPVSFTDQSLNIPNGWAWYFGDEKFASPSTQVTAGAGWSPRALQSTVIMPDSSIVLMGGYYYSNEVWRSTDAGAKWTRVNQSPGWAARSSHSSVATPDGSIILMGGSTNNGNGQKNDTWLSPDNGITWTLMNASSGWTVRYAQSSVAMPDGSIVLMGGYDGTRYYNDTWRSKDKGATWSRVNASSGWAARYAQNSLTMADGSIVLIGGYDLSKNYRDVWRSTDSGSTWRRMNASAGWSARNGQTSAVISDGSIVLMGGNDGGYKNDVWRSTDYGATWTLVNASSGWAARYYHTSVAMPDGSIVLMGGWDSSGNLKNDVWRIDTAGSLAQNPSHTYSTPGTYTVQLQAFNDFGSNRTRKAGYIRVGVGVLPLPGYTNLPTDPDHDGIYEDLNGNGRLDFADVVLYFNQMEWIAAREPVSAFDLNGNSRIDFADIVKLFGEI